MRTTEALARWRAAEDKHARLLREMFGSGVHTNPEKLAELKVARELCTQTLRAYKDAVDDEMQRLWTWSQAFKPAAEPPGQTPPDDGKSTG